MSRSTRPDAPVVIAGLFSTANGIGEAARATYRALSAADLRPIAIDLSQPLAPVDLKSDIPCQAMPDSNHGTLILQLNGPETMAALQHLGMNRGRNWYTIGYWAWELPTFPEDWNRAFRFLSEIWTISAFTEAALKTHPDVPNINIFSHAISAPQSVTDLRRRYTWSDDQIVFPHYGGRYVISYAKKPVRSDSCVQGRFWRCFKSQTGHQNAESES